MNHHVLHDRYGRLFELPHALAEHGELTAFCIDYRWAKGGEEVVSPRERWLYRSVPATLLLGWVFSLWAALRKARPDVVIASSDCLQIIIGAFIARCCGAAFVADLYDDYSTFGLARIPGVRWLYRRALARASGISAVSVTLGEDVQHDYPQVAVIVLESTIDPATFNPQDKQASRELLGIGASSKKLVNKKLIGLCGGLNAFHGVDTVFDAVPLLARAEPDAMLVVAGRVSPDFPLPVADNIHYLGMLPHQQMAHFFSAMDVMIVALSDTPFGYYAFPQKAYEVISCRVPAVAAEVGALARLFESAPGLRYRPGEPGQLLQVLQAQLQEQVVLDVPVPAWVDQAALLSEFSVALLSGRQAA
ncbi:MAG: glycosyltransferase [Parahaliea sp.]